MNDKLIKMALATFLTWSGLTVATPAAVMLYGNLSPHAQFVYTVVLAGALMHLVGVLLGESVERAICEEAISLARRDAEAARTLAAALVADLEGVPEAAAAVKKYRDAQRNV